jgi:hypothetical protein
MGGESGNWLKVFNSQARVYGGIDTTRNFRRDGHHYHRESQSLVVLAELFASAGTRQ